jgi:hypothetical protein
VKRIVLQLLIVLSASLALAQPAEDAKAVAAVRAVLAKVEKAIRAGDVKTLQACYKTNAQGARALAIMTPVTKQIVDYIEAMDAAYGKGSAKMFLVGDNPKTWLDNLSKAKIEIDGDTATVTILDKQEAKTLVREKGTWKMADPLVLSPAKVDVDKMEREFSAMGVAIQSVKGRIGKPGETVKTIETRLLARNELELQAAPKAAANKQAQPAPAPTVPLTKPRLPKPGEVTERATTTPGLKPVYTGPIGAIQRSIDATRAGDVEELLACHKTNEAGKRILKAYAPMMKVMAEVDDKLVASYGKDAPKLFNGGFPGQMERNLGKATAVIKGDKATVTIPGEDDPTELVRENGKWLIVDEAFSDENGEGDMMIRVVPRITEALKKQLPLIGQPGVSAQAAKRMIEAAAMSAIGMDM